MPSRFHWDYDSPKPAAFKVASKFFLASGLCGRAPGQQATANLVKRIQDSSSWDSTLIIITYDENGGRWDLVPPHQRSTAPGIFSLRICEVVSEDGHCDREHATYTAQTALTPTGGRNVPPSCQCP
jgi:hypothetical protein